MYPVFPLLQTGGYGSYPALDAREEWPVVNDGLVSYASSAASPLPAAAQHFYTQVCSLTCYLWTCTCLQFLPPVLYLLTGDHLLHVPLYLHLPCFHHLSFITCSSSLAPVLILCITSPIISILMAHFQCPAQPHLHLKKDNSTKTVDL